MNRLEQLHDVGQSVWLDYICRSLITSGELGRLIAAGVRGVTSNPTIFQKAIGEGGEYDEAIARAVAELPGADAQALYERLAFDDIRMAADLLRPVYEASAGADGFVSLEVSPHLAHDASGTIAEGQRLWDAVARPNLMIKVPATTEGVAAVEELLAVGVSVNATLLFSVADYEAIARAYLRGAERHVGPGRVASVASLFVSRVDTAVDAALEAVGTPAALALRGMIAVANATVAYRCFRDIFHGPPFARLRERGALVQRPLWGSTGTKNPSYPDLLYVEELIGPETVNTVPPTTLDALRDHLHVRATIGDDAAEAEARLAALAAVGIDLAAVTERLQREGVAAFAESFDALLAALARKREAIPVS